MFRIIVVGLEKRMVTEETTQKDNFTTGITFNRLSTPPERFFRGSLSRFAGIIIEYRCLEGKATDIQNQICTHCEEQLEACGIGYRYAFRTFCIVFCLCYENYNIPALAGILKQKLAAALKNCPVNIYYGDEVLSAEEAEQQLEYLGSQLKYSQIYGYDRIFSYKDIYASETDKDYPFHDKTLMVEEKLLKGDYKELTRQLGLLGRHIMESGTPQGEPLYSYHSVYLFAETALYLLKLHFRKNVWDSPLNPLTLPELLDRFLGIDQVLRFLSACAAEYEKESKAEPAAQKQQSMAKFLHYIDQNLATVTLNSMAEHFYITPAYLSRIFKKGMGQNFSEYLSDRRLEKAVFLLEQGIQINDISRQLGYASPAYFLSKFKEKYGMPPSIYRKKLLYYKTGMGEK